jgi:hypothetical protein
MHVRIAWQSDSFWITRGVRGVKKGKSVVSHKQLPSESDVAARRLKRRSDNVRLNTVDLRPERSECGLEHRLRFRLVAAALVQR